MAILDFEFDSDSVQYIHLVQLKDDANEVFYDKLAFIFIEISKFNKSEEELEIGIDKWCYALKNLPNLRKRPKALGDKIFAKLFREAKIARFTEEERMSYEESLKRSRDYQNTINTSFNQGKIEGEREGIVKGKLELSKEFVRNAIKKNLSVSLIAELTGLSKREIEKIKKQLKAENQVNGAF